MSIPSCPLPATLLPSMVLAAPLTSTPSSLLCRTVLARAATPRLGRRSRPRRPRGCRVPLQLIRLPWISGRALVSLVKMPSSKLLVTTLFTILSSLARTSQMPFPNWRMTPPVTVTPWKPAIRTPAVLRRPRPSTVCPFRLMVMLLARTTRPSPPQLCRFLPSVMLCLMRWPHRTPARASAAGASARTEAATVTTTATCRSVWGWGIRFLRWSTRRPCGACDFQMSPPALWGRYARRQAGSILQMSHVNSA